MTTGLDPNYRNHACEFTVGIKLNIPIEVNPLVFVNPPACIEQKLPIYLEPDILLRSQVSATPPVCLPHNGYNKQQLPANEVQQSAGS